MGVEHTASSSFLHLNCLDSFWSCFGFVSFQSPALAAVITKLIVCFENTLECFVIMFAFSLKLAVICDNCGQLSQFYNNVPFKLETPIIQKSYWIFLLNFDHALLVQPIFEITLEIFRSPFHCAFIYCYAYWHAIFPPVLILKKRIK